MEMKALVEYEEKAAGIFTPARLKKGVAILLVAACCAGGGAWYRHEQKELRHAQAARAQTAILAAQAKRQGVALLDESAVRALAAQIIGKEENSIAYRKVLLKDDATKKDGKPKNLPAAETKNGFRPVWKISCAADSLKYKLHIDAVTGEVLKAKVE